MAEKANSEEAEKVSDPKPAENTDSAAKGAAVKIGKKNAPVKLIVLGCVLAVCLVCGVLTAGTAYAFTSNKSIPLFSSLVESVEETALTDDQTADVVQTDAKDLVFSTILAIKKSGSASDMIVIEASEDEIKEYIDEEQDFDSVRFDMNLANDSDSSSVDVGLVGFVNDNGIDADLDMTMSGEGYEMNGDGEFRVVGDKAYLKIATLPDELAVAYGIDSIVGEWIEFSEDDLSDPLFSQSLSGISDEILIDDATGLDSGAALTITKDDLDKIEEFIDSDAVGDSIERIDDEDIEGVRTNCFEIDFNKENVAAMSKEAARISGNDIGDEDVDDMSGEMDNTLLKVCSGRRDGHIYKAVITSGDESETKIELKLWDYDKVDDKVDVPEGAISFLDVYQELVSTLYGGTTLNTESTPDYDDYDWDSVDDLENYDWLDY